MRNSLLCSHTHTHTHTQKTWKQHEAGGESSKTNNSNRNKKVTMKVGFANSDDICFLKIKRATMDVWMFTKTIIATRFVSWHRKCIQNSLNWWSYYFFLWLDTDSDQEITTTFKEGKVHVLSKQLEIKFCQNWIWRSENQISSDQRLEKHPKIWKQWLKLFQ